MDLTLVADILKAGLSGLVFLLMFLSYRLLAKEQSIETPRPEILSNVKSFARTCVLLIVFVAGTTVFERVYLPNQTQENSQSVEACRDSLLRLKTLSSQNGAELTEIRTLIANHSAVCEPALEP